MWDATFRGRWPFRGGGGDVARRRIGLARRERETLDCPARGLILGAAAASRRLRSSRQVECLEIFTASASQSVRSACSGRTLLIRVAFGRRRRQRAEGAHSFIPFGSAERTDFGASTTSRADSYYKLSAGAGLAPHAPLNSGRRRPAAARPTFERAKPDDEATVGQVRPTLQVIRGGGGGAENKCDWPPITTTGDWRLTCD